MPINTFGRPLAGAALLCLLLLLPHPAAAQRALTLDDLYDPNARINFNGTPATGLIWIDDGRYAWPRDTAAGVEWTVVNAADGSARPLYDPQRMQAALTGLGGMPEADARRLARSRTLTLNASCTAALLAIGDDLYTYNFANDHLRRLTSTPGVEEVASFSPDGTRVAFVRGNNLHVTEIATARETALTSDGAEQILNGKQDWVYEEEIYGRGEKRAYWWSPDSSRLAFLRLDDRPVSTFVVVDDIPDQQTVERWDYPRAGEDNPLATLGVVPVTGGTIAWIDVAKYPAHDRLIVGVDWPSDGKLVFEVQDRLQRWLDLNVVNPVAGTAPRTLFRETSKAWINPPEGNHPVWLMDGSFLWLSERSGWQHLYHYAANGSLIEQVTSGKWELREFHGIDERTGWLYFSGTERSHIGRDVYRVRLDGSGFTQLSSTPGTHTAAFSPSLTYYVDSWSDVTTPMQVRLHRSDGSEARVITENVVPVLNQFTLARPEFLQVPTRDGFAMEAMIIKPPDFDPSRRYPVYQFTYGGPQAPQVRNAWGGTQYLFHQLLAQKGIIVWICDNRSASGKGIESAWPIYRNLGELELRDIEDCLSWLKEQPYVDSTRIGIHGWSYGGYMTSYALTHSKSFVMGIAGGTVSDWRAYDTVYTERYMGLPAENPSGYRRSAPRWAAASLHGALLLIHGAIDDNVHTSNTLQFAYELQKAHKPFQMMLYPRARHGVTDPDQVKHLRQMMLNFIEHHLK